jgi:hypothetical protein
VKEAKGEDVKKLRRRWKEAKAAAVHDPGSAGAMIEDIFRIMSDRRRSK